MASLLVERFRAPSGTREARGLDSARKRIVAELAGRTVWCASAPGAGAAAARRLRAHLGWANDDGVAAAWLRVPEAHEGGDLVADVRPEDIVVLHEPLTAVPAEAVRDRGAHAVWYVGTPRDPAPTIDAYIVTRRTPDGAYVVAALMPRAGILAVKEMRGDSYRDVGWSGVLADVVRIDREECVGGTLHARPTIAPR